MCNLFLEFVDCFIIVTALEKRSSSVTGSVVLTRVKFIDKFDLLKINL